MPIILTKIIASNIHGRVNRKITTEVLDETDYMKAVKLVEEKYIKPLGDGVKRSISNGYSIWELKTEYEPGKWTGVKFKLEKEYDDLIF